MSNENVFISMAFEGENADNSELKSMDVVNTIEGFEESIETISKAIYGKDCNINCSLKAPKKGSFELEYIFQLSNIAPSILFSPVLAENLPNILAGLHEVFIKLKGEKIKTVEQNNENGLNINAGDGSNIVINNSIFINDNIDTSILKKIGNSDTLRAAITKEISPVANGSANKVIYKDCNHNQLSVIEKKDCDAFKPLTEKITEEEKEMKLWVKGLSFDGKKWDFQDKKTEASFSAPIKDDDFQKILLEGEAFKNGDSIIADVFIKYSDKQHIKNKYTIIKVIKHINAPTQLLINDQ